MIYGNVQIAVDPSKESGGTLFERTKQDRSAEMSSLCTCAPCDIFAEISTAMPNFKWYPVLSDEPDYDGETGFFNAEKLKRLAVAEIDIAQTGFYTCGPPIMMKIVDQALQELGVPKKQIHYEKFSF